MTATILEPTAVETNESVDDVNHIVCHCKNDVISWCGLDVSDLPLLDEFWHEDQNPTCVLCVLILQARSTCPWGCRCSECVRVD